jgi:hypothetical protein
MMELGKRYECEQCGTEVLCARGGEGAVKCCDVPVKQKEPRKLPTSD